MHITSERSMQAFALKHVTDKMKVLDVGSLFINGSYRKVFKSYKGMDLVKGDNVDIVGWKFTEKFDVIISGQVLEHVKDTKEFADNIKEALKTKGLICIIAPSAGPVHSFPTDERRLTIESMKEIFKDFKCLECYRNPSGMWKDVVFIGEKRMGEKQIKNET